MKKVVFWILCLVFLVFASIAAANDGVVFPLDCVGEGFSFTDDACFYTLTEDTPSITGEAGETDLVAVIKYSSDVSVGKIDLPGRILEIQETAGSGQTMTINGGITCDSARFFFGNYHVMNTLDGDHYESGRLINAPEIYLDSSASLKLYQPLGSPDVPDGGDPEFIRLRYPAASTVSFSSMISSTRSMISIRATGCTSHPKIGSPSGNSVNKGSRTVWSRIF